MLFNSYEFILGFLPLTVVVFFLLGKLQSKQYAILWLIVSSLFYYGWWNPVYLILISGSILVNYFIGLKVTKYNRNNNSKYALYFLYFGILLNLLLLAYFKYSNFFITTINAVVGFDWGFYNVILPIGISFFTFQQIAYLVDTASKKTSEHNLLHYSLFVVFFPQLIAGPIVHHKQMLPQFSNDVTYQPALDNISIGISIFVIGLFKKVILADNLALIATPVFDAADAGNTVNFFQASSAMFAYSLQLYFDFSGYSDMAIGVARLFGIKLPLNFFSPYKAKNIIDFWKRWHMTLSVFLRDYLYIPLGGNQRGSNSRYINLMLTMTIGGLWHGAAWTFVAWGALHGVYIIINHLWQKIWTRSVGKWWSILLSQLFTFVFVSLAWVLFRAETFSGAMEIYSGLLNLPYGVIDNTGETAQLLQYIGFSFNRYDIHFQEIVYLGYLFAILVLLLILPNTQQLMSNFQPAYDFEEKNIMFNGKSSGNRNRLMFWNPTVIFSIFISVLFVLSFLSLSHVSEFLYFQF